MIVDRKLNCKFRWETSRYCTLKPRIEAKATKTYAVKIRILSILASPERSLLRDSFRLTVSGERVPFIETVWEKLWLLRLIPDSGDWNLRAPVLELEFDMRLGVFGPWTVPDRVASENSIEQSGSIKSRADNVKRWNSLGDFWKKPCPNFVKVSVEIPL